MSTNRTLYPIALGFLLVLAGSAATAADVKAGKALHDANCVKCHDSSVYTRKDRKVTSIEGLQRQVKRCELSLGLTWFDEQVDDVVQYLNTTHYKLQ